MDAGCFGICRHIKLVKYVTYITFLFLGGGGECGGERKGRREEGRGGEGGLLK